jgi:two-component system sensor histidine kinase CiaH
MFRSATFKLTMWYLAIVMLISIIFSLALYNVTTNELDRGLRRETQRIDLQFPVFDNDPDLQHQMDPDASAGAHTILFRLITLNLVVLVGAGFASYWLARRTLEPIEIAHEQQKRFTSDVSHELRTPLTALRMESEVALLNHKSTAADLRHTLNSNLEEVTKLDGLINNLLRLTQLEADEIQQHFQHVSSKDVLEAALERATKLAKARRIKLKQTITDASILGDEESLIQLVVILLDNAIKYSPEGKTVTLDSSVQANDVIWRISDEGNGIDPVALEHAFDRFYRADSSRAKAGTEGYGLGLSIAKMIADVHQGNITLKSRVGHGTTAVVVLPNAQPKQDDQGANPSSVSDQAD